MIRMAAPSKDPRTGIYHFRRVVPEALRTYFDKGRVEYKRTLDTRDPAEARERYPAHALIYEQKLAAARRALLNQHLLSATAMVDDYLAGRDVRALQRTAMKLAMLEAGSFDYAQGLNTSTAASRYDFGAPPSRDDLDDHRSRKAMLEAVPDLKPLPWLETLQRIAALPSLQPIEWAITDIAGGAGVDAPPGCELYEAIGRAFLDRLCAACAVKVEPRRTRIIPAPIIVVGSQADAEGRLASSTTLPEPASAAPTITDVFEAWRTHATREPKLVDEWRTAVNRFAALHGDLPVDQITASMVRDYRRTCARLPSRARKEIASLSLREQVEAAESEGQKTLAPATVNKALSAIRVMLDHAVEELEILGENVARTVKSLPKDEMEDPRLPFEPEDLRTIYGAPLPIKDGVSIRTLLWILLLAPFTGCRLEELGKLRPCNIRRHDGIDYIAIETDRRRVRDAQEGPTKRVKTASSKRDIPVHSVLIEAGFLDLVSKRRAEGVEWLFPELEPNKYGNRTQRLSRVINDHLDAIGLSDPELVFHSFRHTGKRAIRGKVAGEIVDLLFGHADGSVSSKYGRGADMGTLRDAIQKIAYPEVDWDRVITAARAMANSAVSPPGSS